MNKQSPQKPRGAGLRPGPGRPRGSKNRVPGELRALVLGALDEAGGVDYLTEQARTNAPAFLALVGKCLPRDLDVSLSARVSLGEMVRQARERLDRARPPGLADRAEVKARVETDSRAGAPRIPPLNPDKG